MNRVDVALTYPLQASVDLLKKSGMSYSIWDALQRPGSEDLCAMAKNSKAMITLLTDRIDSKVLSSSSSVKVIANNAVGFNNIDLELCRTLGISVCNTPNVLTDATADIALGLMIDRARNISYSSEQMRAGKWHGWDPVSYVGTSLRGKKLGIIGMGRIGQAMARRAHFGLEMEILYTSTRPKDLPFVAQRLELDDLLTKSDFISIHCALTPQTRGLISTRELKLMKSSAILINTSRGEVINELALANALKSQMIAGAALDVFESEPLSAQSELFKLSNVSLTPHIGSADKETREAMAALSARNIINVLAGVRPEGEVYFAEDF